MLPSPGRDPLQFTLVWAVCQTLYVDAITPLQITVWPEAATFAEVLLPWADCRWYSSLSSHSLSARQDHTGRALNFTRVPQHRLRSIQGREASPGRLVRGTTLDDSLRLKTKGATLVEQWGERHAPRQATRLTTGQLH